MQHLDLTDKNGNKIDLANNPQQAQKIHDICNGLKKSDVSSPGYYLIANTFNQSTQTLNLSENSKEKINDYFNTEEKKLLENDFCDENGNNSEKRFYEYRLYMSIQFHLCNKD